MERHEHLDELVAEAVLEGHAPAVDPARHEQHLLVLDVDALHRADPLGEVEDLGLGEGRRRVPAAVTLPDHRRVQALLDRRPDREGRREVVALDDEVRAVADADLVDLREQLVGGVPREDVGGAGLDPDPDEREEALLLDDRCSLELVVAELDARELVRPLGVGLREGHRHVEVRHAGLEARVEDRHVEERVDGVQHRIGPRLADQVEDAVAARGVDAVRGEARVVDGRDDRRRSPCVVVGEGAVVEERAPARDRRERRADAAGADDEDPH